MINILINANPLVAKAIRRAAKFKVSDIVRESGLSRSYVHGFRKGEHINPNVDNLQKIIDAVTKLEATAKPGRKRIAVPRRVAGKCA